MAAIVESIEIARSPADVFAYVDDLSRHGEWQEAIVSTQVETEGPTDVRRVPGGPRPVTYEITEHDPPRRSSFRGVNGPVRPVGTITVQPAGTGSRLTVELDLQGQGIGKLVAPFARRQARQQVPKDQARLKERLESGA